jgi:peptidoglycan hydrolase CwlO-like protein
MVCKMVKKAVVGSALAGAALYCAFGTELPSYVKTAFHKVRHTAKDSVPIQFEIDRARDEIAGLEPMIIENREILARGEVDVEQLEKEIVAVQANLAKEKQVMVTVRESLKSGDLRLTGRSNVSYTPDEVKGELAQRIDHYKYVTKVLENKQATLKARHKAVENARKKLAEIDNQKRVLATKIEAIQARLEMIEATEEKDEFHFDNSALSHAKQAVSDLERRLEVKARVAEMSGQFSDSGVAVSLEPGRDPVKEFDAEFGQPSKDAGSKTGDKSL